MKRILRVLAPVLATVCLQGCQTASVPTTLDPGFYHILHSTETTFPTDRLYVIDSGDTIRVLLPATGQTRKLPPRDYRSLTFYRTEVDVDVFTIPFKVRPAREGAPPQLNSNFNAALYLGRRIDFHRYRWQSVTPTYGVRQLRSQGFGYGLFAGIGSATINEFVTRLPVTIEYEGVVLDLGLAALYDARIFNVGLAVGTDHLLDRNRRQWIYQHRPWFGVLFGLNLN